MWKARYDNYRKEMTKALKSGDESRNDAANEVIGKYKQVKMYRKKKKLCADEKKKESKNRVILLTGPNECSYCTRLRIWKRVRKTQK